MAFKVGQFDVVENGNNKTPFIFLAVSRSFASKLGYYLTVSSKPPKFPSAFPKDYDKSSAVRRRSSYPAVWFAYMVIWPFLKHKINEMGGKSPVPYVTPFHFKNLCNLSNSTALWKFPRIGILAELAFYLLEKLVLSVAPEVWKCTAVVFDDMVMKYVVSSCKLKPPRMTWYNYNQILRVTFITVAYQVFTALNNDNWLHYLNYCRR